MNKETLIFVGSTGLIGREVLESLSKKDKKIYLLLRRLNNTKNENINNILFNFDAPSSEMNLPACDHLFICIGRRLKLWELIYIRKKDRKDHFKIEHDYIYNIAKRAKELGAKNISLISAVGANSYSSNFYLNTKGRIEESIKNLGYKNINILRPGHIIINKSKSEIGLIVWLVDLFFKLVNPFLIGFLSRYRGISLKDISIFMANKSVSGIKIFYYDDFIK